ncbi:MAG: hypothetical protein H0A76_04365 [Candidatus Thiodubiliella endoseptemdiera]|uniref:Uncharacterized protein n=1 Tax=Candidatus Thiodubiliella endoseptemdiera TaxID=2738886 RepID=A0A853EZW0_9GAMM|nr:hypothetical protein [Candidatus Thiodubiliella endoseptemdiera]
MSVLNVLWKKNPPRGYFKTVKGSQYTSGCTPSGFKNWVLLSPKGRQKGRKPQIISALNASGEVLNVKKGFLNGKTKLKGGFKTPG